MRSSSFFLRASVMVAVGALALAAAEALEPKSAKEAAARIEDARVKAHVEALADPKLDGRLTGTQGAKKAVAYIAKAFEEAGLSPLPGEKTFVVTQGTDDNVLGVLAGGDRKDEAIVVSAHWDGIGKDDAGTLVAGADDNASGLAALLEIVRVLAKEHPRRTIVFAAFGGYWDMDDAKRFRGARAFLRPLEKEGKIAGLKPIFQLGIMTLGCPLLPWQPERYFTFGAESSSTAVEALKELSSEATENKIARCSVDLIEKRGPRDDYDAFRAAKVPFLFFTSGVSKQYHKPGDVIASVVPKRIAQGGRLALSLVAKVDAQDAAPAFTGDTLRDDKADVAEVLGLIEAAFDPKSGLVMTAAEKKSLTLKQEKIKDMLDASELTPRDRGMLKETLELLLYVLTK
ncbi:M28 family peptidase [bacterium]|nr:M28 family peptidase [bacterium]